MPSHFLMCEYAIVVLFHFLFPFRFLFPFCLCFLFISFYFLFFYSFSLRWLIVIERDNTNIGSPVSRTYPKRSMPRSTTSAGVAPP